MSVHGLETNFEAAPLPEEVRTELDKILSTPAFRRSDRQSRFLRFVCEATLEGNGYKLNEILIAHEVFGRGLDYSPGEDAVVRRQAHSLRQKLQDYHAGEGVKDAIRIDLPVGRYVPLFVKVSALAPPVPLPDAPPPVEVPAPRVHTRNTRLALAALVLLVAAFIAGWLLGTSHDQRNKGGMSAAIAELWGPWLSNPAGAVICFSNPLTTVVKHFPMALPSNSLPRRLTVTPDQDAALREMLGLPAGGFIYLSPAITQAKMGEAIGAVSLVNLFGRSGIPVQATQSRFVNWEDFRTQNLVLLGHDESNRWLDPILKELPFRLGVTEADRPRRIVNQAPRAGERPEYRIQFSAKEQPSEDYALISMIEGVDHQHELLLLNGLNTEGTESAVDFLTNPSTAQQLLSALHEASPSHSGPWRFQCVLHTEVRDKVPTSASVVALRVLPR